MYKYLDIEASFSYAPEDEINITTPVLVSDKYSYYTLNMALKPKYAIKNHVVFGVLGLSYFNGTNTYQEAGYPSFDYKYKGMLYNFGLGYEYKVNKNHSVAVSYTYNIFGDIDLNGSSYNYDGIFGEHSIKNYNQFNISYKYTFK